MTGRTHILGGVLAGELMIVMSGRTYLSVPIMLAGMAGSLLPDIDKRGTTISEQNTGTKIVSCIASIAGHRGFFHTPLFAVTVTLLLHYVCVWLSLSALKPFAWAFGFGIISHIILDAFNPVGVPLLWPVSVRKINVAAIRTSSTSENIFRTLIYLPCCWLILWVFPSARNAIDIIMAAMQKLGQKIF